MTWAVGSLVRARGREWVVLPDSSEDLLMLRPLGGADEEVTGIYVPLEKVEPARFEPPDPSLIGDNRSCGLLRDAVRFSSRAGAGPFRSFARIAVEPRPYQLVPLLMALKLDPVRLLIADDVGIGKTVEACLIARELLDRGEIARLSVLCPPHLADQWQVELRDKFHIEAELVLSGTAARLEKECGLDQSLFEVYPHTIVSMDYIKSERHRGEFLRAAPELIIVDEAHTCAYGYEGRGRHQRNELLRKLSEDPMRHLILVTAIPHSGKEEAFRSLLALLRPDFAHLPDDLAGPRHERQRRSLAAHFVQRRRADIKKYLDADTPFPEREEKEVTYRLSSEYRSLFERALSYARESVSDRSVGERHQRVRWWSALALLRSLASSPAAAAETLRTRARVTDSESVEEADEVGRRTVLDVDIEDYSEGLDAEPGARPGGEEELEKAGIRRRLLDMARIAESLRGDKDRKLIGIMPLIHELVKDGFNPIIFCRFIPTADYLADELRRSLQGQDVEVVSVTGVLPPDDRRARISELAEKSRRVLICTDCLSEGINLQDSFDAVIHYDLSWNPTRHEQREGRVDRFGQRRRLVRALTYYGLDNWIDGIVLDVLIRKHRTIRNSLGISVPVPLKTNEVMEAILEGILLKEGPYQQEVLPGMNELLRPHRESFFGDWEAAAEREKRSRTMFTQESIKVEEVARELQEVRAASGDAAALRSFIIDGLAGHGAVIEARSDRIRIDLKETSRALRDYLQTPDSFIAAFDLPVPEKVLYLSRTHPLVEGLSTFILDSALDARAVALARRAGVVRTRAVTRRTTLLLLRLRYDLLTARDGKATRQLAEECRVIGFSGAPAEADWLGAAEAEPLLAAQPGGNIAPDQASSFISRVVEEYNSLLPRLDEEAHRRAAFLLEAHRRVRAAAGIRGVRYDVEPRLPVDLLGVYVYLPATGS